MYDLTLTTPPVTEPITYAEAKHQLSLCHDEDLTWIEKQLIPTARQTAEISTHRQFLTATWTITLDCFPVGSILIPLGKFQTLDAIRYVDAEMADQTVDLSSVWVAGGPDYPRLVPAFDGTIGTGPWPTAYKVEIDWTCGFGERSDIPENLKQGMLFLVSHLYEQRQDEVVGAIVSDVPETSKAFMIRNSLGDDFVTYDTSAQRYELNS